MLPGFRKLLPFVLLLIAPYTAHAQHAGIRYQTVHGGGMKIKKGGRVMLKDTAGKPLSKILLAASDTGIVLGDLRGRATHAYNYNLISGLRYHGKEGNIVIGVGVVGAFLTLYYVGMGGDLSSPLVGQAYAINGGLVAIGFAINASQRRTWCKPGTVTYYDNLSSRNKPKKEPAKFVPVSTFLYAAANLRTGPGIQFERKLFRLARKTSAFMRGGIDYMHREPGISAGVSFSSERPFSPDLAMLYYYKDADRYGYSAPAVDLGMKMFMSSHAYLRPGVQFLFEEIEHSKFSVGLAVAAAF